MPNRPVQIIIGIAALGLLGYGAWSQFGTNLTQAAPPGSGGSNAIAAPATEPAAQPLNDNLGTKNVDFEAARAAKAQQDLAASAQNGAIIAQSQGMAQGVAVAKESKVPVLMPSGLVQPASNEPPSVKATKDGYFARFRAAKYDLVVNGSAAFVKDPDAAPKVETASNAENYKFEQVDGGATLAFSRFGADYFMEFECREGGEDASCVTEAEAIDIAKKLRIAGQP